MKRVQQVQHWIVLFDGTGKYWATGYNLHHWENPNTDPSTIYHDFLANLPEHQGKPVQVQFWSEWGSPTKSFKFN
jgi:hypothetical protein